MCRCVKFMVSNSLIKSVHISHSHLPSDKCRTLAIFFMVASNLESACSISAPNSSSILKVLVQSHVNTGGYETYTACSSSSFEMCSDMFLMLPMLSAIRSIVSSCLCSISCCCSSCTMYSLWGESAVLGRREYLLGPVLACCVGELG